MQILRAVGLDNDEVFLLIQEGSTASVNAISTSANITDRTWNHITVTVGTSGNTIYVNGVEQVMSYSTGNSSSDSFFDNVSQLDFMSWGIDKHSTNSFSHKFDGFIDDGRIYDRVLSSADVAALYAYRPPAPQTFTVTNTNDSGAGSLRQAIIDANANAGFADTIEFNIPGSGTQVITPSSALDQITDEVYIDGTTQAGWVEGGFLPIVLDGDNGAFDGLTLTSAADNSTIRGLVISDFGEDGIQINVGSDNNTIAGNWIGRFASNGTFIAGEEMVQSGIEVLSSGNTIGGITAADRNVIEDYSYTGGVRLEGVASSGNVVSGNYFGTGINGNTSPLDQSGYPVLILDGANNNTIGGSTAAHRNVFGEFDAGVLIDNFGNGAPDANVIQNNNFGLGANGSTVFGVSGEAGVTIHDGTNTLIGGVGNGNTFVTSGDSTFWGIRNYGPNTIIQGNFIGTDSTGTVNGGYSEAGIIVQAGGDGTQIGGVNAGEGNVITNSDGSGIDLTNPVSEVVIRGNSLYGNDGIGIDLGSDGPTLNDAGDADTGANNLQNWPLLDEVSINDAGTMSYRIDTSTLTSGTYTVDFYASSDRDGGQVEGKRYLFSYTLSGGGSVYNLNQSPVTLAVGEYVTLITTDSSGNSSELSSYAVVVDGDTGGTTPTDLLATTTTDGGLSINADGGNDVYLLADDGGAILGGLDAITVEVEYSVPSNLADYPIISYASDSGHDNELMLYHLPNGRLKLFVAGKNVISVNDFSDLSDGTVHTVAATWDTSGAWEIFIDGELRESGTGLSATETIATGGTLIFGQEQDSVGGRFSWLEVFDGTLNRVRVFDSVRTDGEIAASYRSELPHNETGMVAQWNFDNLSSDGVVTESVSGNNLTVKHVTQIYATVPRLASFTKW